jgi:hypothetical protein
MKAFPTTNWQSTAPLGTGYDEGMDLRDYFAAKAMQGLLATVKDEDWEYDDVAFLSYGMADVMMKAREEK